MTSQRRKDDAIIFAVQKGKRKGKFISCFIKSIISHQTDFLERFQLHRSQKLLLMKHALGRFHHIPKFPHFCGQLHFDGTAVFTHHKIFIFPVQTIHLSPEPEKLENKKYQ